MRRSIAPAAASTRLLAIAAALACMMIGCGWGGGPRAGEPCGPAAQAVATEVAEQSEGAAVGDGAGSDDEAVAEQGDGAAVGDAEEAAPPDPLDDAGSIDDDGLPGFPYALAIDPDLPSRAWFTIDRGLLASDDGGVTWEQMQSSKIMAGRIIVTLRPPGGDLIVAGPGVLRRSEDDGATWVDMPGPGTSDRVGDDAPSVGPDIRGLALDPSAPSTLHALIGDGTVQRSDDGGATWRVVGDRAPAGAYGLWPIAASPTVLWTVSLVDRSVCRSSDGGSSWAHVEPEGLTGQLQAITLADDGVAYAATIAGLYRSDDGGATWEARGPFRAVIGAATQRDRSDTVLVIVFGGGIFKSEDGGLTWGQDGDSDGGGNGEDGEPGSDDGEGEGGDGESSGDDGEGEGGGDAGGSGGGG